jgi:hypothetical protein
MPFESERLDGIGSGSLIAPLNVGRGPYWEFCGGSSFAVRASKWITGLLRTTG